MKEEEKEHSSETKKWIGIFLAVVLIIAGFYIYYLYFYSNSSMALINPELNDEINILVIGWGDEDDPIDYDNKKADAVVMIKLLTRENKLIVNSVPSYSAFNGKLYKDYNITYIRKKMEKQVDSDLYYFTINYDGFKKIVNELSGIEVKLDRPLEIPELGLYLDEGKNLLSGKEALNYARWYQEDNNKDRIHRQYDIVKGILDKILQKNTLLNVPKLYSTLVNTMDAVDTNLDKELITGILNLLRNKNQIILEHRVIELDLLD